MFTTFSFLFSLSIFSSEVSELPNNLDQKQRVQEILENSRATRASLNTRKIASFTAEEKAWANEFEVLMQDNSNVDYLKLSLEL